MKIYKFLENTLCDNLKDNVTKILKLSDDDLYKLIGFKKNKYKLTFDKFTDNFILSFKESFLEKFLNFDEDDKKIFTHCLSLQSYYSDYEEDADNSELGYINRYLNNENLKKLKSLLYYFDVDFDVDDERVQYILEFLENESYGEELMDLSEITNEISIEWTNAIKQNAKETLNSMPFKISFANDREWDLDLEFSIDKIEEYINKYNLEDINTIKDFLENVNFDDFTYKMVNDHYQTNYEIDTKDINKAFGNEIDKVLSKIDITEPKFEDPRQLKLFGEEEYSKLIRDKQYTFEYDIFKKFNIKDLWNAKELGGRALGWFKSYQFQKNYVKEGGLKNYRYLNSEGILNPIIKYEFEHLDMADKFNL